MGNSSSFQLDLHVSAMPQRNTLPPELAEAFAEVVRNLHMYANDIKAIANILGDMKGAAEVHEFANADLNIFTQLVATARAQAAAAIPLRAVGKQAKKKKKQKLTPHQQLHAKIIAARVPTPHSLFLKDQNRELSPELAAKNFGDRSTRFAQIWASLGMVEKDRYALRSLKLRAMRAMYLHSTELGELKPCQLPTVQQFVEILPLFEEQLKTGFNENGLIGEELMRIAIECAESNIWPADIEQDITDMLNKIGLARADIEFGAPGPVELPEEKPNVHASASPAPPTSKKDRKKKELPVAEDAASAKADGKKRKKPEASSSASVTSPAEEAAPKKARKSKKQAAGEPEASPAPPVAPVTTAADETAPKKAKKAKKQEAEASTSTLQGPSEMHVDEKAAKKEKKKKKKKEGSQETEE